MAKKPIAILTGQDGNVFNLLAICNQALKNAGLKKEAKELNNRAWKCKSYDEVLILMHEYVEVR